MSIFKKLGYIQVFIGAVESLNKIAKYSKTKWKAHQAKKDKELSGADLTNVTQEEQEAEKRLDEEIDELAHDVYTGLSAFGLEFHEEVSEQAFSEFLDKVEDQIYLVMDVMDPAKIIFEEFMKLRYSKQSTNQDNILG